MLQIPHPVLFNTVCNSSLIQYDLWSPDVFCEIAHTLLKAESSLQSKIKYI